MIRHLVGLLLVALSFPLAVRAQEPAQTAPPAAQNQPPAKPIPTRVRMGGNVTVKILKHKVNPSYPQEARKDRIQGTVRLHVIIGRDGRVQHLELISGHPVLAKAAIEAVRQWGYRPTLLNGEPVEVDTVVDVVFSLAE